MIARYVGVGIGAWYLLAPFLWGYPLGFLWWHDVALGAVITALAGSFLLTWSRLAAWGLIGVGYYSMLAPFLHGYLTHPFAFWNDLVFGILTVGTGMALAAATIEYAPGIDARTAG